MLSIFDTIASYADLMVFVVGMCLGAVIATVLFLFATYRDYKRALKNAKERIYEDFDWEEIMFRHSFWNRDIVMEITLPEV